MRWPRYVFGLLLIALVQPASADKVLIGFKDNPRPSVIRAFGGRVEYSFDLIAAIAAEVPSSRLQALARHWDVLYVEPDYPVYALDTLATLSLDGILAGNPVSVSEVLPWGIQRIGAPLVWAGIPDSTPPNTGEGVIVAIIDTGIDYTHPDLAGAYVLGYDFVNKDWDPLDDNGHGTHVAGIIAAADDGPNSGGGNTSGLSVVGVSPGVSLYIAKSLNAQGTGSTSNVVAAIDAAAKYGVNVVNMSFGSPVSSKTMSAACDAAYRAGVLLVAASGNEAAPWLDTPARYSSVVSVGAINEADARASFSNYSKNLEMCAPGVDILSTMPTYTVTLNGSLYGYQQIYDKLSGTSMACPHVVGAAALVWAAHPEWTNVEVRRQLQLSAENLGSPGRDKYYGYGLVDAAAAAMQP